MAVGNEISRANDQTVDPNDVRVIALKNGLVVASSERIEKARALYNDLVQEFSRGYLRDPDPVIRRSEQDHWDRRCRDLRKLSPWYAMRAERDRRVYMKRHEEYDRFWYGQRMLRQRARQKAKQQSSF
jgi:hypothetical protein